MIPHTPTLTTDDVDEAWSKLLAYYGTLENGDAMPKRVFDLVLKHTRPVSRENGTVTVACSGRYEEWLNDRLATLCSQRLSGIMKERVQVRFEEGE